MTDWERAGDQPLPCRYIKILPLTSYGNHYNRTLWCVTQIFRCLSLPNSVSKIPLPGTSVYRGGRMSQRSKLRGTIWRSYVVLLPLRVCICP